MLLKLYTDGSGSGVGAVLKRPGWVDGGQVVWKAVATVSEPISGITTNEAEYLALIKGLEVAIRLRNGIQRILCYSDSMLVVMQVRGEWKIKTPHLKPYRDRAVELLNQFDFFKILHIPGKENMEADELSRRFKK